MKHLSAFVTLLLVVIAALSASGVRAYFELDERVIGTPKKTVLADGRVHIKFDEVKNKPWPSDIEFPKTIKLPHFNDDNNGEEETPEDKAHYINFKGEAIMPAHWEVFNVADHTDASKLVCHDRGDKNMRISLFDISAKFTDYLKNKKESIILTATATKHICHGDPIFRVVTAVHFFENEVLLITDKASYEDIFEHADVGFDIKHPLLTHIRSDEHRVYEEGDDHGVSPKDLAVHKAAFTVPSTTFGSEAVPAHTDRMHARDTSEVDGYKINKEGWSIAAESASESAPESDATGRKAQKKGWFKKLKKKVKKFVKKVVKKVKKAVSKVVKAVAKGIKVVKNVWNSIKNLLTLTIDKKINKSVGASKKFKRSIKGILVEMNLSLKAGFKFQLYIKTFRLKIFHASVYGSLDFGGSAEIPRRSYANSGQSTLFEVPGTVISFAIGPVPVWIKYSTKCLAGYTMGAGLWAKAGFRLQAGIQLGVEYTSTRGFRMINSRYFKRTQSLEYDLHFEAAPSLACQGRFALYSAVTGYAQLNMGLDVVLTTRDSRCDLIKIYAQFFIQLSAGLDIELKLLGKSLFSKEYGPWTIANWKWTAINVCKQKRRSRRAEDAFLALPMSEQQEMLSLEEDPAVRRRDASLLSDSTEPITELTEDDSGKTWNSELTCPSSNLTNSEIDLVGFFQNDTTVFFVTITRNITTPVSNESNMTYTPFFQSALASIDSNITLGQTYNFQLLKPTVENAEGLGLDYDDIETLTKAHGDSLTKPLNLTSLTVTFGASNLEHITVSNPALCPQGKSSTTANTSADSSTEPSAPPEGSYFGRMFANFGASLFPAFIRLVTDVLVIVLILAAAEFVLAYLAPRFLGEHWPKTASTPRTREWVYMVAGVCVGLISMIIFIVGANVTFAEITGAQLAPNFTAPAADNGESSFLTASGVQTIVWKFAGASIELNKCPQYYPCSPDCRDLCNTQTRSWTNAPWPFCPDSAVETDNGGCTKFAWDNILNAIFFVGFLFIGTVVCMKKCDTIYRRLLCLHACLMLAGMFLNLMWRRMASFMTEVEVQMFDPADEMIIPFDLAMNPDSTAAWKAAITIYWIMVGIVSVGMGYDIYLYRKDTMEGKITRFDDGFEANYEDASASGNARPRANTDFAKDVAADLANINESSEPTKEVNTNELALM